MAKQNPTKRRKSSGKKVGKKAGVADKFLNQTRNSARKHRQVIYLNDSEMAAIRMYCDRFRVRSRSALFRNALMSTIISVFDENQPTLF